MDYGTVSDIQGEIAKLVPVFEVAGDDSGPAAGKLWPFLNNGKFNFDDGIARLRLTQAESYEPREAMPRLS